MLIAPPQPGRPLDAPRDAAPLLVAGVLALGVALLTFTTGDVYDDPAILRRYAVNLAHGDGWVFNPGQQTANAVTSPLTVLLLAAGVIGGLSVNLAASLLFAVTTWGAAYASYLTFRAIGHPRAGLAASLLVATAPPLLVLHGMETSLLLALIASAMWCQGTRRLLPLGILLGLAVLARPDAALFGGFVVVALWRQERRLPWLTLTGGAAVVLPWLAASVHLTGSLLPSTAAAKIAQERSGEWPGFLAGLLQAPSQTELWFLLACPFLAVGLVAAYRLPALSPLGPLTAATVALIVSYEFILGVAYYPWYGALPVFALILVLALGVEQVAQAHREAAVLASVTLALAGLLTLPTMQADRREQEQVATWLKTNTPEDATVAAIEIGRLGLLSNRPMVDYLGLLDPQANKHVAEADWTWWLDAYQPDYWVTYASMSWDVEAAVTRSPRFSTDYSEAFRTNTLLVFERRADA